MEDGLLARLLTFVSPDSYPDRSRNTDYFDPPAALVEAFQAIAGGVLGDGNLESIMTAGVKPEPYYVPLTGEAEAAHYAMEDYQLECLRAWAGTYKTSIAARFAENALKLSLIRAVSRDPAKPVIEARGQGAVRGRGYSRLDKFSARAFWLREAGGLYQLTRLLTHVGFPTCL